ncbi:uncharacterized protein AB675_7810 [Cyphellophora attinorum]|uniref:Heterokaryon incompatibility domain-containing protein n=1 Tax=Cyphellophora attinorum TaxID=1664694 RepID=A0A0N0NMA7_9EURO|nr:uncharacterized protein AB675_7810 [Phialophora attinorum]KPI40231.1 hypothetical protein AB675_7810 [Phialophora attinorum]
MDEAGRKRQQDPAFASPSKDSHHDLRPGQLDFADPFFAYNGALDASSELCSRCQRINFEQIAQLRVSHKDGCRVGSIERRGLLMDKTCPLCGFLQAEAEYLDHDAEQVHPTFAGDPYELRAYATWSLLSENPPVWQQNVSVSALFLRNGQQADTGMSRYGSFLVPVIPTRGSKKPDNAVLSGSRLVTTKFRPAMVQQALRTCRKSHKCGRLNHSPVLPSSTRFIDCKSRRIVPLPARASYVALSYVWGARKPSAAEATFLRIHQRIPPSVPKTIEDAMEIVMQVGERYLWVDRYCVDQYHSDQKSIQIAAMSELYEGSLFTIVALCDDSSQGLPGISSDYRKQLRFRARGREYVFSGVSLDNQLRNSKWQQRAWVYQEAVLSSRCLFIGTEQAFFTCPYGIKSDTFPSPVPEALQSSIDWSSYDCKLTPTVIELFPPPEPRYGPIELHLWRYTLRSLTERSDALNAFRGILTRSVQPLGGVFPSVMFILTMAPKVIRWISFGAQPVRIQELNTIPP